MSIPAPAEQRREQHEHNTWRFVTASGELGHEAAYRGRHDRQHIDHIHDPAVFKKLDVVAVLTGPLLPAPLLSHSVLISLHSTDGPRSKYELPWSKQATGPNRAGGYQCSADSGRACLAASVRLSWYRAHSVGPAPELPF